ncbi:MAG: hypothetical protein EAZ12_03525 [Sphingobacteriia bacterium]|nr:MAG: hypothetical protein EAZ12_03525 [Sphingobacteriia bacterium]
MILTPAQAAKMVLFVLFLLILSNVYESCMMA